MSLIEGHVSDDGQVFVGWRDGHNRGRYVAPDTSIAAHGVLTPQDEFGDVERGNPLPYTLPPEKQREVGLTRETWRLEVIADPESDTKIERPLSKEVGTALDFDGLMKLAEQHAVRYMKGITCNNIGDPLGMGFWEGVPLRVVVWMTGPLENLRRLYYYGYHNDDPAQMFQSSLAIGRVLEEPPGELPVLLAYKLNGEFLTGQRGGPVRMLVPEAYGFKSVKWLQRVVLTNDGRANDTYALDNNDLESPMKTFARFVQVPGTVKAGKPTRITGLAQVGLSGVGRVQFSWAPQHVTPPEDDPHFSRADWHDAEILPPPESWGGGLPDDWVPDGPLQFDPATGAPRQWPLRYTIAYWEAVLPELEPGSFRLRCRTIDLNGFAQPMPRPFAKSGRASIHEVPLTVEE